MIRQWFHSEFKKKGLPGAEVTFATFTPRVQIHKSQWRFYDLIFENSPQTEPRRTRIDNTNPS